MINTVSIKQQQMQNGFFQSGSGPEKVLIMGSCRVAPYCNYLEIWNNGIGNNRFTIYSIDPHNWHFDPVTDKIVDLHAAIDAMEAHEGLLDMLKSVDIFIHEWYANYGMFNTFKDQEKSIYYFCSPKTDICLPNFNDIFILFSDFYKFDAEFKEQANREYAAYGKLTEPTQAYIIEKAHNNLEKFYDICRKSSLPQMATMVSSQIKIDRFFWNFNHISSNFSFTVFYEIMPLLNIFLNPSIPDEEKCWNEIKDYDMFKDVFTPLTEYDVANFGFNWGEHVVSFKEYNKIGI